ncbi:uncharacterized protein LOC105422557 [Pogonomyrmex barbatus]|uniref:Uncharacterized protein LOC105422557 n=1 Tax=Pogonomyrmex barbatus TaxID=144034 RepID=A0A6I9VU68_9HYME|nr:uncharacterized protein LOC105422557 [Pogonomyrmex barbatus]
MYVLAATNMNDIMESVPSVILSIIFSWKVVIIMFDIKKVKYCLQSIEKDWQLLNTNTERTILQRHAEYGQFLATAYAIFVHVMQICYILKPIIPRLLDNDITNSTKPIPKLVYPVEYGVDIDQYFYPISIHCYLALFAHSFGTIAVDILYCILIQHACGMFTIIEHILEEVGKDNNANFQFKLNKTTDIDYKKALNCLRKHLQVIKFVESIESVFTKVFLISVNLNVICGSISGIQVILNLDNPGTILTPLALYTGQLGHLFIQFWQAQFILDYSTIPWESM